MLVASPQESRARRRGAIAHRGGTSGGDRREGAEGDRAEELAPGGKGGYL